MATHSIQRSQTNSQDTKYLSFENEINLKGLISAPVTGGSGASPR